LKKILIASKNKHKIREFKQILSKLEVQLVSALEYDIPKIKEDKNTLVGNATKKATLSAMQVGLPTIADDTGIFVKALNGQPGIYAARYAGEDCEFADNRLKILENLENILDRRCYFETVICLSDEFGKVVACKSGRLDGTITTKETGKNGFGYDDIFLPSGSCKTMGQMSSTEKNKISHRSKAISKILSEIERILKKQKN